jgi:cell division protein FtsB
MQDKTMTDPLQEQTQQIGKLNEQVNTLTSQRDALLEVCRAFV